MNGWFRRNRWALIALVVLIPAAVAAAMSIDLFRYYADQAQNPTIVPEGEAGEYVPTLPIPDGAEVAPVSPPALLTMRDFLVVPWNTDTGREVGLLEGTEAVSVLIDVDATKVLEGAFGCDAVLVAPGPDGERTWPLATSTEIDYYPSGDLSASCTLSDGEQFTWEAVFVVPEGVADDAALYIIERSLTARRVLQLEH